MKQAGGEKVTEDIHAILSSDTAGRERLGECKGEN
jgi:hypothetical protein